MSHLKITALVVAALLAVLAAPLLFPPRQEAPPPITHGMPWQIELPAPGASRVFGLRLGGTRPSSFADARRAFPEIAKIALLSPTDKPLALEAYFETVAIGPLNGKLVLSIAAAQAELEAMRARAVKTDHLETGIRKFILSEADRQRAENMPLTGIVFIPSASLDEAVILQRFGVPAERIRQGETLEHFLYPDKGLDLVLDSKGREVLQYVAPADFPRLRAPLG